MMERRDTVKESKKEIIIKILKNSGQYLLFLLASIIIFSATLMLFKIPMSNIHFGISSLIAIIPFYLLNKNIADTIKNMKFLFSFAAGTYWIQTSKIGYRSPNLYRLFCPGRFLMLYAAMGINIEFVGKVRRYTPEDAKLLFGNNTGFEPLNVMINRMASCNIPEVYKITAKFKDLTPNAFNIQAAYFTDTQTGDGSGNINIFPKINVHTAARAVSVEGLKNYIQNGLTVAGSDISLDNNR